MFPIFPVSQIGYVEILGFLGYISISPRAYFVYFHHIPMGTELFMAKICVIIFYTSVKFVIPMIPHYLLMFYMHCPRHGMSY